jgi:hypothetical protein
MDKTKIPILTFSKSSFKTGTFQTSNSLYNYQASQTLDIQGLIGSFSGGRQNE